MTKRKDETPKERELRLAKKREANRAYREANREALRAAARAYREANREAVLDEANREALAERKRKYRLGELYDVFYPDLDALPDEPDDLDGGVGMSKRAVVVLPVAVAGRRYVGIDPGRAGAAVVVGDDGLTILAVQRWAGALTPPSLTVVLPGDVVALEAQYLGANPRSMATLVEWCGRLLAGLPLDVVVTRPLATTWRGKVLRKPRMSRLVAKRMAVTAAAPYLAAFDPSVRWREDDAEAFLMARYARFWAANELEAVR